MRQKQRDDINQRIQGVNDDILDILDSSLENDREIVIALCALTKAVLLVAETIANVPGVYKEMTR